MPCKHNVAEGGGAEARALEQCVQLGQSGDEGSVGWVSWQHHTVAATTAHSSQEHVYIRRFTSGIKTNTANAADPHACILAAHARADKVAEIRSNGLVNELDGG